jgi:hypothetical protein
MNSPLTLIHPTCCTCTTINYKYPTPILRTSHRRNVFRDELVFPPAPYIGNMRDIGRIVGGIFTSLEYTQLTDMWIVVDQIHYKSQLTNDICRSMGKM